MGKAWSVVDPFSQISYWSAVAVAVKSEPAMLTVTGVELLQPPNSLVTVTVKTCGDVMGTVWVVWLLGLVTMLAGSQ